MSAATASPTPLAGDAFVLSSSIPDNQPPYEHMILTAILELNSHKGSTHEEISEYITDNYSDLPSTHSTLLTHHLRNLLSKDVIRMRKLSYKLTDGTNTPKRFGRPPKLGSDIAPMKKKKRGRPRNTTAPVANGAVYILPQDELLNSGFLQSFPGAAAIVLPKSLLRENAANSPILILPNGIQSLVEVSLGKRKRGRPKNIGIKKMRGRPRKEADAPKPVNFVAKESGQPWKIRDLLVPGNSQAILDKFGESEATGLEAKKRPVRRPRKYPLIEGPNPPPAAISR